MKLFQDVLEIAPEKIKVIRNASKADILKLFSELNKEAETNKLSQSKKRRKKKATRRDTLAADALAFVKRANTDRTAFVHEAQHSDLLPEAGAIQTV